MEWKGAEMRLCIRFLLFCALCCFIFSQVYAGERVVYRGTLEGAGEEMALEIVPLRSDLNGPTTL
jgi:hypothetical protein